MARRNRRSSASRRSGSGGSAFAWFVAGILIGLAGAVFLYSKGWIPALPHDEEVSDANARHNEPELLGDSGDQTEEAASRYDFFTVLPEMEVVVPERELSSQAQPQATQPAGAAGEQFILQVGSFRNSEDAEQMKARLALLGSVANIQQVTVNNETWYRVRVGPITGAPEADRLRRQLQENRFDVLVLKDSS